MGSGRRLTSCGGNSDTVPSAHGPAAHPSKSNSELRHPRASGGPCKPDKWIPAPRLRGDKLRGNDVSGVIPESGVARRYPSALQYSKFLFSWR
jgi:hypothetical protein